MRTRASFNAAASAHVFRHLLCCSSFTSSVMVGELYVRLLFCELAAGSNGVAQHCALLHGGGGGGNAQERSCNSFRVCGACLLATKS